MKQLLAILCMLPFIMAPRGGKVQQQSNTFSTCAATSGNCPANLHFCVTTAEYHVWRCAAPNNWTDMTAQLFAKDSTLTVSDGKLQDALEENRRMHAQHT